MVKETVGQSGSSTAKINTLSAYECDTDIEAINLGNSLAFISKTPV